MRLSFLLKYLVEDGRGFTLIEILVTISIIFILLSLSFVSFSASRDRSNDALIKENLGLMRVEAERIYKMDRDFLAVCSGISSAGIARELPTGTVFKCLDDGGYAFEAQLSTGDFYCVDATGRMRENGMTAISAAGTACGGNDCDCR